MTGVTEDLNYNYVLYALLKQAVVNILASNMRNRGKITATTLESFPNMTENRVS